jgi:glycosyltransferase involved in cell wall biosynthesis
LTNVDPKKNGAAARKTILFSGHDLKFIRGFMTHCESLERYRVLIDQHPGHQITNPAKSLELLPSADVIFCEWCLGNAKWYSQRKRPHQRLLIRVHHQEMELPYRWELEWENVDAIIFTNFPHYERFCREQSEHKAKALVIYCDVDCEALDREKLPCAEFNLGLVGINPMRKRPDLALEILRRLRQNDSRYSLFFKTRMPWEYKWLWDRPNERDYFNAFFTGIDASPLRNSVVFDAHGDDMPLWYSKVGFILSTSDHEGSHQAVAEGMASGCVPVIRCWKGAAPLYPHRFVYSSVNEAVEMIRAVRTPRRYGTETAQVKDYARAHFAQRVVYEKFEALFDNETGNLSRFCELEGGKAESTRSIPRVMMLCYLPPGFRGGYRIRIEQEVKVLTCQGCEVHLVCLHPHTSEATALEAHRVELARLGGKVYLLRINGFFDIKLNDVAVCETLGKLQSIVKENNLHILHAEALYCTRIGLLLKQQIPGLRVIFDCHGTSPEEERMGGAHPARVKAMQEWEYRALTESDLNIFVSEAMLRFYLKEYELRSLPHIAVPCCVAEERFPATDVPSPVPVPGNRLVFAYAGTMAAWQCGDEMIRLFAQLQEKAEDALLLLLAPQGDHKKVRDNMVKYRISEAKVLLADLPHDQVAPALQRAHAGLLLRRTTPVNQVASPTKFGEYLAAGIPVILTEGIGDFSEMSTSQRLGLVLNSKFLDLDEIPAVEIERIIEFARDSMRERQQMSGRCRRAAVEHLHWDRATNRLFDAYAGMMTGANDEARIKNPAVLQ